MKKLAVVAIILATGGISLAADRRPNEILTVLASVRFNNGSPRAQIVFRAEGLASQMFAGADVSIIWHRDLRGANRNLLPILIDIAPNSPDGSYPGALAYSAPFGGNHITIFWDRLERAYNDATTTALLAHVLVHEITHILQRSDYHSGEGIMKAHWTELDIAQMMWKPLSLNPGDVELIHAGLVARKRANEGIPEQVSGP